jgi:hypothetical protein
VLYPTSCSRHVSQQRDPYNIGKWHETMKMLQSEHHTIKQIEKELSSLSQAPASAARPAARQPQQVPGISVAMCQSGLQLMAVECSMAMCSNPWQ